MRTMSTLFDAVRRHRQALFAALMVAAVLALLWTARGALPAFVIGLALVFVLDPIVNVLTRIGVPRWAGVLASYAIVVGVVWAVVAYALPPIAAQARELVEHLPELGQSLSGWQQSVLEWYAGLPLPDAVRETIDEQIAASGQLLADFLAGLLAPTVTALLRAATFIVGLVVVPVWLFFVLKDRARFVPAVTGLLPMSWRADLESVLGLLGRVGGRWVRGQLLLGTSIFLATVIGLTILTFLGFAEFGQFTLILALIAGVLEWVPIIGPIISAVPAILIGLTIGLPAAIAAAILYTVIQQLENHILVPKVMGDAVELHPAVLIMSLVIGGSLFGIGGAILAAPVVASVRDLYRYGFHRFGGSVPVEAYDLVRYGEVRPAPELEVADVSPEVPSGED